MPAFHEHKRKRPGPDAYDHLWPLLPVFAAYFAVIVFAAGADLQAAPAVYTPHYEPLPMEAAAEIVAGDASVPSAADALARLPDTATEAAPTF